MKPELSLITPREPVTINKRKRIPLSVRYEVIRRQCPPEIVEKVEAQGGKLKDRYAKLMRHAVCAMTGEELIVRGCEFDHKLARALGGSDDPENIQALIPAAHRRKTDADDALIAKANRRALETGQQKRRMERGGSSIQNQGFDKTLSKKFDGTVVRKQKMERGE